MKNNILILIYAIVFCVVSGVISLDSFLWATPPSVNVPDIVSDIVINIETVACQKEKYVELAENLILLKKGSRLEPALLKKSINTLTRSRIFESVFIDTIEKENKTILLFHLRPFRLIRDIRIHGAFPLFEKDILTAMTLTVGDRFSEDALPQQVESITRLLNREGYETPKVELSVREIPSENTVIITVDLDKGKSIVLNGLTFEGNRSISDFALKRFNAFTLKKDIQRLTEYYRKKGFADCAITYTLEKTSHGHVTAHVHVDEGPRYRIRFSGNRTISGRTLKKKAVSFDHGNRNDSALKKIASRIKDIYRDEGFEKTQVKIQDYFPPSEKQPVRIVEFLIEEGPRLFVKSVTIKGNESISTTEIEKQLLTRKRAFFNKGYFSSRVLEDDLNAVRALYRKNGFMNPEISYDVTDAGNGEGAAVDISIIENVQTRVAEITINGLFSISRETALKSIKLKKGDPFRRYMLKSDENVLSALISETGHPFVEVKGNAVIGENGKTAIITYDINEGPPAELGEVFISGNLRTKDYIISRELELAPGDPFSLEKMLSGQKNLRDMDIFRSVRYNPMGLKEKEEKIHLFIDVEEKKPYYAEFGLGFETQRGGFFQAKAGDHNLFGTNKNLRMEIDASQIGYRFDASLVEPRLMGSKISMNTGFYMEKEEEFNQDFGTMIIGANMGLSKKFFKFISASVNLRFEQRDQFGTDEQASEIGIDGDDETKPRILTIITPSVSVDTRDSFLRPKKGFFSSMSLDFSKGINRSLDDFIKYRIDARYYYTPLKRLTLALIGRFGHIEAYGAYNDVPDDQMFFLGGISDVRGVNENMLFYDANEDPLGGRTSLSGSIEARIDLGRNFELPLFFDTGKLSGTPGEGIAEDFRSAAGFGLRYITPIGPVGFLYGINLDPEEGEPSGRLHFSIGYTF